MLTAAEVETEFVTPPVAAAILGVSIDHVRDAIRAGEIPAANLAKRGALRPRYYVRRSDLDRYIDLRAVTPNRPSTPTRRRLVRPQPWHV